MEPGFLIDTTHGGYVQQSWLEGLPEHSRWVGLKTKGKRKIPVISNRCARCGFLENWATGLP